MIHPEQQNQIRQYLPNLMTFLSLSFGLLSIFLAIQEKIRLAGLLIIISVILDTFDGTVARKLNVVSQFGLQLDSLADLVSFGVAPIILVLQHLTIQDLFRPWLIPLLLLPVLAGAFRLARFNLQPPKKKAKSDTHGITITNSGIIFTLAVLSDLFNPHSSLAQGSYTALILILSYLMISKLQFPSMAWLFPAKWTPFLYIIIGVVVFYFSSLFTAFMIFFLVGLAASIIRELYRRFIQGAKTV
jgi:CDP-diacylglycerol--serine O-phosphatidyltransferase